MSKTFARNCEIFESAQAGHSHEELALRYGLTPTRIRTIIHEEKLKRAYSTEEAYRSLRRSER